MEVDTLKKFGKVVLFVMIVALFVPAVMFGGSEKDEGKSVVLLNIGMQSSYPPVYTDNLEMLMEKNGVDYFMFDGKFDPQLQASQMDDAIAMHPDIIVLFAVDSQAIAPGIKKAYDAGIHVFMGNSLPMEASIPYTVCYSGPNNFEEGQIAGKYMNEMLGGKGNIVIIEGAAGQETSLSRTGGFMDVLAPGIKVLAQQPANWRKDIGVQVMQDFITRYGDEIDAVYCHGDASAMGAAIAYEEAGYAKGEVPIICIGGGKEGLKGIVDGYLVMNVLQSPIDETNAYEAPIMEILNSDMEVGEQLDPYWQYMVTPVITMDNVEEHLPGDY